MIAVVKCTRQGGFKCSAASDGKEWQVDSASFCAVLGRRYYQWFSLLWYYRIQAVLNSQM